MDFKFYGNFNKRYVIFHRLAGYLALNSAECRVLLILLNFRGLFRFSCLTLYTIIRILGSTSKAAANKALDSLVDSIKKTLKKDNKVTLVDFGIFSVGKRAARKGRNPETGAVIKIKASKTAKFKAGKAFKGAYIVLGSIWHKKS